MKTGQTASLPHRSVTPAAARKTPTRSVFIGRKTTSATCSTTKPSTGKRTGQAPLPCWASPVCAVSIGSKSRLKRPRRWCAGGVPHLEKYSHQQFRHLESMEPHFPHQTHVAEQFFAAGQSFHAPKPPGLEDVSIPLHAFGETPICFLKKWEK